MAYEINFCETKEQLKHLGEVVTGKVDGSPTGADIGTSTLAYTGQERETLPALLAKLGWYSVGDWSSDPLISSDNQYVLYNGIRYVPLSTPYQVNSTANPDPEVLVGSELKVITDVTNEDITTAQNDIVGGSIFKGSNGDTVEVGDAIPGGTTHLKTPSNTIKWIALSDEFDPSGLIVSEISDYEISFTDGKVSPLLPDVVRHTKTVTYAMFGANPRGVIFPTTLNQALGYGVDIVVDSVDSAPFIEKCHEYCAPYAWGGSIAQTKKDLGKTRAKILDDGNYVVNQPIKINPFLIIESTSRGGWFSDGSGLGIYGNFSDNSKYLIDSAPMFSGGSRPLGGRYSRGDWDNGNSAGCMGWQLLGINARMLNDHVVKGILNRQLSMESVVRWCGLGDMGGKGNYEGICSSVCWGGEIASSNVKASFVSLLNINDVTTDDQHNNYLPILGTPPTEIEYTRPPFPVESVRNMTSSIINSYAEPHSYNNTCEGGEVGFKATNANFQKGEANYYEKVSKYVYAVHSVNCQFEPKYIFCAGADLIWIEGSSVNKASINLSSTSFMQLDGWGNIGAGVPNVDIIGSINARKLPFNPRVNYTDIAENEIVTIYCSQNGDDSSSGFSEFNKVKTIQEAMYRASFFKSSLIEVSDGVLLTKDASGLYSAFIENKDIAINMNGATCSPGSEGVYTHRILLGNGTNFKLFSAGNIDLSGAANSGDYRAFITCRDAVNISLRGGSVTSDTDAGRGYLIGSQFGNPAIVNVSLNNFEIGSNSKLMYRPEPKGLVWTQVGFGTTVVGTSGNADDGKVFSSDFA